MAQRPIFVPNLEAGPLVREIHVAFQWHAGMSLQQKRKSIASLHSAAQRQGIFPVLEISTKSDLELGRRLSAFHLTLTMSGQRTVTVEAAYQGGKVFEKGGPYRDLYGWPGREIKADERLRNSGRLLAFDFNGVVWPLEPKTAFYDWLYITALTQNPELSQQLLDYRGFSDIEFNPDRSINCQARAAALYVALYKSGQLTTGLANQRAFIQALMGDNTPSRIASPDVAAINDSRRTESMPSRNTTDKRLIEHYLPIERISNEARREKSVRKGHISTLHLWWARRPLVAARAAVFGALVPEDAADPDFVAELCTYPGPKDTIAKAQRLILEAHAERLSKETAEQRGGGAGGKSSHAHVRTVTAEDIEAGRAPRPRVLDMFAGGGAIPLEALRLGCEAYALDLNPVAHLIELCTLVYPQKYGQPDPAAKGCLPSPAGGRGAGGEGGTWAGLAAEVEHWGKWVLKRVKDEIGDLYPPIPDPRPHQGMRTSQPTQKSSASPDAELSPEAEQVGAQLAMPGDLTPGGGDAKNLLTPVAYLWTRTVRCKNPACGGTVPLARQTWLAKKKERFVALRPDPEANRDKPAGQKTVRYHVVEAETEKGLGFDPEAGSKGGSVACPFCGTVADSVYVMSEGKARHIGYQLIAMVCVQEDSGGKIYLDVEQAPAATWPDNDAIIERIHTLEAESSSKFIDRLTVPVEPIREERPSPNARGLSAVTRHGFASFADLFTPRQSITLLTFTKYIRASYYDVFEAGYGQDQAKAITTYLAMTLDRVSQQGASLARWDSSTETLPGVFSRQALQMVWDFAETNPLGRMLGGWESALEWTTSVARREASIEVAGKVYRASATETPFDSHIFDAIVTDPPYYDNVPYSDLSDFFYVWLKRTVGFLYPEHFSSLLTPKKQEATMDSGRHRGDSNAAKQFYEQMMAQAFTEAARLLKPTAPLVIVYAHKTTLGWATLVDALRVAGFTVTEAWPLDTEMQTRMVAMDTSALASSIFLVARRREGNETGAYETVVRPELESIVRERVETLWAKGITGADLVIACVGAGLRAFTRFARVEYANGEEVPADKFLGEVEGVVLETLLEKLFGVPRAGVSSVDAPTRFYVLWRYAYRAAAIDAGEAIVFAWLQGVELDGARGLSAGSQALVEKQKSKYRLRDFTERGDDEKLGLPAEGGTPAPLIDVLHRLLHLMETSPADIPAFLDEARPNLEQLHLAAQTLAGSALAGNGSGGARRESLVAARGAEAAALRKLTTNWRTVVEAGRGGLV
jgi:putative DNA methylase